MTHKPKHPPAPQPSPKRRVLVARLPTQGRPAELEAGEAEHAVRVLRIRDGEAVEALDGKGGAALASLRIEGDRRWLEFISDLPSSSAVGDPGAHAQARQVLPMSLVQAVLKAEAMEWVVEKAVELGAERLVPVLCAHCVVQVRAKGPELFQARWQRIADQALKQCGRRNRLEVLPPQELTEWCRDAFSGPEQSRPPVLWLDERSSGETPSLESWLRGQDSGILAQSGATLLVGPEGGWSEQERLMLLAETGKGITVLGLGPLILRAETAALAAMSLLGAGLRLARP